MQKNIEFRMSYLNQQEHVWIFGDAFGTSGFTIMFMWNINTLWWIESKKERWLDKAFIVNVFINLKF